jgi:CheY-like chemotaxis protein
MSNSRKKILLVEDNSDLLELLTLTFKYLAYDVVVATTGEEAVEQASAAQPDLILMDLDLPKFNGVEATIRIKQNRDTAHIPIVILTAFGTCPNTERALESGAAEILRKPVTIPKLQEALHKHLPVEVKPSIGKMKLIRSLE